MNIFFRLTKMNSLLLIISLVCVLSSAVGAPALSSVHVRFVSGNKATQYSHGSLADGTVQFNVVGSTGEGHAVRKRSATQKSPSEPRLRRLIPRTTPTTTTTTIIMTSTLIPKTATETKNPTTQIIATADTVYDSVSTKFRGDMRRKRKENNLELKRKGRKRVDFIMPTPTVDKEERKSIVASSSERASLTSTMDTLLHSSDAPKRKDSKAVKRSPYLSENFAGGSFNFPDFDEFGGNDFGSLSNFGPSSSGSSHPTGGHGAMSAEALAPEGVFLPPIPTQASNYVENDPYLSDPETAKYASQHPPYFHEFPHKRTVLSLNQRREENGLEPNILRSIRPFFAFFEINKRR